MGRFKEYDQYDGLGLAELVKKKEISAAEICEEAIARIEDVNPTLNAVIATLYDQARQAVKEELPDGPFCGVPFLLKDLLGDLAGVPQTMGSRACQNFIPARDSELVKRYRKAGLVFLGKTNTPEFGLLGVTEPELHGPTRNPWNPDHTPGGSSGGSAAAVAGGMVPLASANDGAGSIRIPASCCGLFGLKVTRGRTPNGPTHGRTWQGGRGRTCHQPVRAGQRCHSGRIPGPRSRCALRYTPACPALHDGNRTKPGSSQNRI